MNEVSVPQYKSYVTPTPEIVLESFTGYSTLNAESLDGGV